MDLVLYAVLIVGCVVGLIGIVYNRKFKPTVSGFSSDGGTYTTPEGVSHLKVKMIGAGGSGSGSDQLNGPGGQCHMIIEKYYDDEYEDRSPLATANPMFNYQREDNGHVEPIKPKRKSKLKQLKKKKKTIKTKKSVSKRRKKV